MIIQPNIIEAALWIHNFFKQHDEEITFCGSFGLVFNGYLKRDVSDIDILTNTNFYGNFQFFGELHQGVGNSGRFFVGGQEVFSTKLLLPNRVIVDCLWKQAPIDFRIHKFNGIELQIENPIAAIEAKKQYLASPQLQLRGKHEADLKFMLDNDIDGSDLFIP